MITANELRIGNWVRDHSKGFLQVESIHQNTVGFKCESAICHSAKVFISPIPLTPEILSKCLTKMSEKEFKIELPVSWSKTHHTDYWFIVKWYEWVATGESHTGWRPYIKEGKDKEVEEIFLWGYLETLHQLQNFYFSLVQSELPYKP